MIPQEVARTHSEETLSTYGILHHCFVVQSPANASTFFTYTAVLNLPINLQHGAKLLMFLRWCLFPYKGIQKGARTKYMA